MIATVVFITGACLAYAVACSWILRGQTYRHHGVWTVICHPALPPRGTAPVVPATPAECAAPRPQVRPHTRCVDAWADREPAQICPRCAPTLMEARR